MAAACLDETEADCCQWGEDGSRVPYASGTKEIQVLVQPSVSVTRSFQKIVNFFSKNVEKIVENGQNCVKKGKFMYWNTIYWIFITKYHGSNFQNFHNCGNSGHTSGGVLLTEAQFDLSNASHRVPYFLLIVFRRFPLQYPAAVLQCLYLT